MSVSCLHKCREGDVILWSNNNTTRVVGRTDNDMWPIVAAVNANNTETGNIAQVNDFFLNPMTGSSSVKKIIKGNKKPNV